MSFFRMAGGRYTPQTNGWNGLLKSSHRQQCLHVERKWVGRRYHPDMKKLNGPLKNFKNTSALLYVQASLWAREGIDDALITNTFTAR